MLKINTYIAHRQHHQNIKIPTTQWSNKNSSQYRLSKYTLVLKVIPLSSCNSRELSQQSNQVISSGINPKVKELKKLFSNFSNIKRTTGIGILPPKKLQDRIKVVESPTVTEKSKTTD